MGVPEPRGAPVDWPWWLLAKSNINPCISWIDLLEATCFFFSGKRPASRTTESSSFKLQVSLLEIVMLQKNMGVGPLDERLWCFAFSWRGNNFIIADRIIYSIYDIHIYIYIDRYIFIYHISEVIVIKGVSIFSGSLFRWLYPSPSSFYILSGKKTNNGPVTFFVAGASSQSGDHTTGTVRLGHWVELPEAELQDNMAVMLLPYGGPWAYRYPY